MEAVIHMDLFKRTDPNMWNLEQKFQEMELEAQNRKKILSNYSIRIYPPEEEIENNDLKRKIEDRILQTHFKKMKMNDSLSKSNGISSPVLLDLRVKQPK